MKKRFASNRGFTLVELIIAFAILTIVSIAVASFTLSGIGAYNSVYSNVNLQTSSQMTMNQIQEYLIDCNGGLSFSSGELNIFNIEDDGTIKKHTFSFTPADNTLTYTRYHLSADGIETIEPAVTGLVSDQVSAFAVYTKGSSDGAETWNVSSAELIISFVHRNKTYSTKEIVALRNMPLTGSQTEVLQALAH